MNRYFKRLFSKIRYRLDSTYREKCDQEMVRLLFNPNPEIAKEYLKGRIGS